MEIWKQMVYQNKIYNNLEISTQGRLRNIVTGTIYKLNICGSGYLGTVVSINKRKKLFKVHKAVAETFILNPNNLPMVNHKDGIKTNNFVENLEWCTAQENIQHSYRVGLHNLDEVSGVNSNCAKLNVDDIKFIRKNYIPNSKQYGCRALARKYNVSHTTITDILHYNTYKNI